MGKCLNLVRDVDHATGSFEQRFLQTVKGAYQNEDADVSSLERLTIKTTLSELQATYPEIPKRTLRTIYMNGWDDRYEYDKSYFQRRRVVGGNVFEISLREKLIEAGIQAFKPRANFSRADILIVDNPVVIHTKRTTRERWRGTLSITPEPGKINCLVTQDQDVTDHTLREILKNFDMFLPEEQYSEFAPSPKLHKLDDLVTFINRHNIKKAAKWIYQEQ